MAFRAFAERGRFRAHSCSTMMLVFEAFFTASGSSRQSSKKATFSQVSGFGAQAHHRVHAGLSWCSHADTH